ncbi:hypothetical protein [Hydrogenophaga sp. 2FB]|uniref:hypothetical protein n=1 Tax=Hydrogenophaga sp. 2FB TaxID=2502187 RepID=UPI0010F56175|nr:hypothetical protein [Hydrogenophaga sp. 2FB]
MKTSSAVAEASPSEFFASELSGDELEVTLVLASVLRQYCDPFRGCWLDIDAPIQQDEVAACLAAGKEFLHPPSDWCPWVPQTKRLLLENRRRHIQKIAWFVKNGFYQPISVDVGVPSLSCHVDHLIVDGNHRFGSAVFRLDSMGEDVLVPLALMGCERHAKSLGLVAAEAGAQPYRGSFR